MNYLLGILAAGAGLYYVTRKPKEQSGNLDVPINLGKPSSETPSHVQATGRTDFSKNPNMPAGTKVLKGKNGTWRYIKTPSFMKNGKKMQLTTVYTAGGKNLFTYVQLDGKAPRYWAVSFDPGDAARNQLVSKAWQDFGVQLYQG